MSKLSPDASDDIDDYSHYVTGRRTQGHERSWSGNRGRYSTASIRAALNLPISSTIRQSEYGGTAPRNPWRWERGCDSPQSSAISSWLKASPSQCL